MAQQERSQGLFSLAYGHIGVLRGGVTGACAHNRIRRALYGAAKLHHANHRDKATGQSSAHRACSRSLTAASGSCEAASSAPVPSTSSGTRCSPPLRAPTPIAS